MQATSIHELFDLRLQSGPDEVFLHTLGGALTFADLGRWVDQLELELRTLEVRPGDRVFAVAENCPEHVALILACSRVNAWACSINARMAAGEVDTFARKADARVAYFTVGISSDAATHGRRHGCQPSVLPGLSRSPVRLDAQSEPSPLAEQVAAIIFTSGTTARQKVFRSLTRAFFTMRRRRRSVAT